MKRTGFRQVRAGFAALVLGVASLAALAVAPAGAAPAGEGRATAGRAVPKGFLANSVSFVSSSRGFALGTAPCGKKTCSDVISTKNGGKTWRLAGSIDAVIPSFGSPGDQITEIRGATARIVWVFGPELWYSANGGRSFAKMTIPGGGKAVADLATSATEAFAVVSDCRYANYCGKALALWRDTAISDNSWSRVSMTLPDSPSPEVALHGSSVYVLDPLVGSGKPDELYASTDGGSHFASRPVPCDEAQGFELDSVAAASSTDVGLLCVGNQTPGNSDKIAYRSSDTGKVDTDAGRLPLDGIGGSIAVSSSGDMIVASTSTDASYLDVNDGHGKSWSEVAIETTGAGWGDLAFVTASEAWVVYGPVDKSALMPGEIFVTHDSGRHWREVKL